MVDLIRRKNTKAKIGENVNIQISQDRSVLSLFNQNNKESIITQVYNGDDYRDPLWIFNKNLPKKLQKRKQFHYREGFKYFWVGVYDQIDRLATLYERLVVKAAKQQEKLNDLSEQIAKTGKKSKVIPWNVEEDGYYYLAHCKPTHKFTPSNNKEDWWLFEINKKGSYSHDWCDRPEKPINLELGQAFYHASQRSQQLYKKRSIIREILIEALKKQIPKSEKPDIQWDATFHEFTVVTGIKFVFKSFCKYKGYAETELVCEVENNNYYKRNV